MGLLLENPSKQWDANECQYASGEYAVVHSMIVEERHG